MAKRKKYKISKAQVVLDNEKALNKVITNYNKRVKTAFKKGAITAKSFDALYYDQRRRQTMKYAIKNKKDLNNFENMLNKANADNLRMPKRITKQNEAYSEMALYEARLFKQKAKTNVKYVNELYPDYDIIGKITSGSSQQYQGAFKLLVNADILKRGRDANYYEKYTKAYKQIYGHELDTKTKNMISRLGEKGMVDLYYNNTDTSVYMAYKETDKEREVREKTLLENIEFAYTEKFGEYIESYFK